jgi:hypothetical protein
MSHFRLLVRSLELALLLALNACGGGSGGAESGAPPLASVGTLAYVVTACRDTAEGFFERQALHILHSDQDVPVMETPEVGPVTGRAGLCRSLTLARFGQLSIARDAFQAVAVSPDGTAVVFEVTDDFSLFPPLPLHLPPEQKGIFFVRADGSGLRALGPPSRLPFFALVGAGGFIPLGSFAFSPDGRLTTFADTGPDAAGNQAGQVWTLDVGSGVRQQVTQLPPAVPPAGFLDTQSVLVPAFIDNQSIGFVTFANADGMTPTGGPFVVSLSDGTLTKAPLPLTLGDSQIVPTFAITGDKPFAVNVQLPGPGNTTIVEVFVVDGSNLLQLTNFQRVETGSAIVGVDRQTVFFSASANPSELGDSNPSENCQIFSIDRLGADLRQLTQFSTGQHITNGCLFRPPGCAAGSLTQDSRTRTVIFYSSCDPLGSNSPGAQIFAMRPDGSELRPLTDTRGLVKEPDGTFLGELPGPFAYGPYAP